MTFYTMTSGAETNPASALMDWLGAKLVECGWESMGTLMDATPITGIATSGTSDSYVYDTTKNWATNEHTGKYVWITSGTGASATRRQIQGNTATRLILATGFPSPYPTTGSGYSIETPRTAVYKSPSPANGLPNDFYVTLFTWHDISSATRLYVALHEQFDPATKTRDKFAPVGAAATSLVVNSDFSFVTTKTNTVANLTAYGNSVLTTSGANWILHVFPGHFILARTNGSAAVSYNTVYAGAFDSFLPASLDPMPLVNSTFYGVNTYLVMATRDPGAVAGQSGIAEVSYGSGNTDSQVIFAWSAAVHGLISQSSGDLSANPFTGDSMGGAQRILLRSSRSVKFCRGLYKDVLTTQPGTLPGQTLDVNFGGGVIKQYVLTSSTGSGTSVHSQNVWVRNSGD